MKKILIFSSILALAVILFVYSNRDAAYAELNALDLIPQSEHFTELYFNNASSLQKQTTNGIIDSFSFTVHNVEGAPTTYPYRVYFERPSGTSATLIKGTVSLADNASTTIVVPQTTLASDKQGKVVVELTSLNQSIDFLLPDTNK